MWLIAPIVLTLVEAAKARANNRAIVRQQGSWLRWFVCGKVEVQLEKRDYADKGKVRVVGHSELGNPGDYYGTDVSACTNLASLASNELS